MSRSRPNVGSRGRWRASAWALAYAMSMGAETQVPRVALAQVDPAAQIRRQRLEDAARDDPARCLAAAKEPWRRGDAELALKAIRTCTNIRDPLIHLAEGYILLGLDRLDEAEVAFRKVSRLDSKRSEVQRALAQMLSTQARWSEVQDIIAGYISLDRGAMVDLEMYARASLAEEDFTRLSLVSEWSIVRFFESPNLNLRRLDLIARVELLDFQGVLEASMGILAREPEDSLAWRQLAAAADHLASRELREVGFRMDPSGVDIAEGPSMDIESPVHVGSNGGHPPLLALAAMEAAELVEPEDSAAVWRRAAALYEAGAVASAAELLSGRSSTAPEFVARLAVRSLLRTRRIEEAGRWARAHEGALDRATERELQVEQALLESGPDAAARAISQKDLIRLPTELMVRVGRRIRGDSWLIYAARRSDGASELARAALAQRLFERGLANPSERF